MLVLGGRYKRQVCDSRDYSINLERTHFFNKYRYMGELSNGYFFFLIHSVFPLVEIKKLERFQYLIK